MASIESGGGDARRSLNREINMIPFIDLLLVIIAFLLITAVWVGHSRIEAYQGEDTNDEEVIPREAENVLHIYARSEGIDLKWKNGAEIVSETSIEVLPTADSIAHSELAMHVRKGWIRYGGHRVASDRRFDRCVLHTENDLSFGQMAALMDAISSARRPFRLASGKLADVSALRIALAVR